jgi:hypothetical protein
MGCEILKQIALNMGISLWILAVVVVWSIAWKLIALWKAARKKSLVWFIILAFVNTIGILEILYVYIFSEMNLKKKPVEKKVKRKIKRRK